jgi:hypothetical protein
VNRALDQLHQEFANASLYAESIEVARNACAAGASIVAAAIAVCAYNDSPLIGIDALVSCMRLVVRLRPEITAFRDAFGYRSATEDSDALFAPGFGFVDATGAEAVLAACQRIVRQQRGYRHGKFTAFYLRHHRSLVPSCGPLNRVGLMALVAVDEGMSEDEAERAFLIWQLDAALVAAQRARARGLSHFPFLTEHYVYDGPRPAPPCHQPVDLATIGLGQREAP